MTKHSEEDREILRHAGMSEQSELTEDEQKNMPRAREAFAKNPSIASYALYRIIRPIQPEDWPV
jgi:hypothetical protein